MHKHRDVIAACIEEGQKVEEIRQDFPALKLAEFFLSSWGRAVMNAKTKKNTGPVDDFLDLMFNKILKP